MFPLKPLSIDAIPAALSKAERYRLLNEPDQAESICLDILAAEPDNRDALVMLLLALTDQFVTGDGQLVARAQSAQSPARFGLRAGVLQRAGGGTAGPRDPRAWWPQPVDLGR